jgi:hypothetical protein
LFFTQYFVESTDGLLEFSTQALGSFGIRLGRELARTACATGAGTVTATAGSSTFAAGRRRTSGTAFAAGFATAFEFGRFTAAATAQAFAGLTHATDTARQRPGISALPAAFAITVGGSILALSGLATGTVGTVTAAHSRDASRHRKFDLGHTAHAAGLTATRGTPARRRAAARGTTRCTTRGTAG